MYFWLVHCIVLNMCSSYSLLQAVTEVNKRQYIHHLAKYLMVGRIAKQLEAFMEGKHRSRIKTKEKSKVVASVWGGGRIYSIPCRASCFALDDLNNRISCTRMI